MGRYKLESVPLAIWSPEFPQHIKPAQAGSHFDAANRAPGRGGLVGRRNKHGDDVDGGKRCAVFAFVERAAAGDWARR